jgi:hypothetical protein
MAFPRSPVPAVSDIALITAPPKLTATLPANPNLTSAWDESGRPQGERTHQSVDGSLGPRSAVRPNAMVGGRLGALVTNYVNADNGLLSSPPRCGLDYEASFIVGLVGAAGKDLDFFPLPQVPLGTYPAGTSRKMAETLTKATSVSYDASDLMTPAMQAAFYQAVLALAAGGTPLDDILRHLDDVRTYASPPS